MASCRVCMNRKVNMKYLFDEANKNIIDKIEFCTGIQFRIEDGFPAHICSVCLRNLSIAHKFKTTCLLSEGKFRSILPKIKTEVPDSNMDKDQESCNDNDCVNENEENNDDVIKQEENNMLICDVEIKTEVDFDGNDSESCSVSLGENKTRETKVAKTYAQRQKEYRLRKKIEKQAQNPKRIPKTNAQRQQQFRQNQKIRQETEGWNPNIARKRKQNADRAKRYREKLKSKKQQSLLSLDDSETLPEVVKRRGRYKKSGTPRLKKYKFRKLFCELCSLKFSTKQESDDHKKDLHKETDEWVCEICGKKFVHRASLYTHVRSHLPPQHACDHCDYRTANKHDLVKHVRIHTGEKHYKCDQCACAYHNASNLRQHKRRQHELAHKLVCPRARCEKAFYDRTKLNRHLDSHDDVKRYICDVCHSRFTRRCYWKKHLLRQHAVIVPAQRPGRQKQIFLIRAGGDA